jgi:enoyl-CoA hydratase/carnithine racemase
VGQDIQYERHGHVRLITIDRADKMNSMDFAASDEITARFREFDADREARVAVVTGAGDRAFCAGADLKTYTMNFARSAPHDFRQRFTDGPGFAGITRNLQIDKPIVAAVNGYAVGGGLELALACDIRFCAPHAMFGDQDVNWGFHACDGGLIRLPRIVGMGNAMEMILGGELIDAGHAHRIGLVNRIYPRETLLSETLAYAEKLATRAPLAQRFAKNVMMKAADMPMGEALLLESRSFRDLGDTEDLQEGTAAFREKRQAVFKGR